MNQTRIFLTDRTFFHYGDIPDAWQSWYDDSDWQEVTLPHDWSVSFPFSRKHSSGTGYLAGGWGWYRIHISPRKEWQGKRISVTFDGIYKNSQIWCNSYYLGRRPNGYISFTYDITDQFRFDRESVISVRVEHPDISDSRWFTGSGITRKVCLTVEENIHPVPGGIFFTTPSVSEESALVQVENEICNTLPSGSAPVEITVTNRLLDAKGQTAAQGSTLLTLEPDSTGRAVTDFTVENPCLWSPDSPCLYTLETLLSWESPEDTVIDAVADTCRVGIRSFRFDPDEGFFLNEKSMLIKGVCVHHDGGCLGAAVHPAVWKRRLQKLKAMGCNAVRMSHNPHMPELYDLCDEMGFLVMDEAFDEWEGPKNKWWQGHNVYPPRHQGYYLDFPQWHRQDLTDLVRRDRNHPSVILWSIGNEIDYPNDPYCHASFSSMTGNNDANKPIQERQYNPERPDASRLPVLAKKLSAIVKENDPTRPVTLAAAFPELSAGLGFLDSVDVAGYNYKEHLYAEHHEKYPKKPFLGSENGHHLAAWKAVTEHPYISGQFLWTGIDYLGEAHGWPVHGSSAGLLTLAGFEKTGYYRRRSFWSLEPMVHLAAAPAPKEGESNRYLPFSECWNYTDESRVLVKCYTNLPRIELFLNEESLGIFSKDEDQDGVEALLTFRPGTLTARGLTEDGRPVYDGASRPVCHSLCTTGPACRIRLSCWKDPAPEKADPPVSAYLLTVSPRTPEAPGLLLTQKEAPDPDCLCEGPYHRLHQIEVTLLDREGRRVYTDSTLLHVTVKNGRLLGLENGDLADVTEYTAPYRRTSQGQLLIYVSAKSDQHPSIRVFSPEGLHIAPAELEL